MLIANGQRCYEPSDLALHSQTGKTWTIHSHRNEFSALIHLGTIAVIDRNLSLLVALSIAATATANAADSFKVVSYNIRYANPQDGPDHWPNRVDAVAKTIDQHDIAGLQEVTYKQLLDLQSRLPDFDAYSVGREDGETAGEHTTILFRRERFEAMDKGTFWLSENPREVGSKSWDAAITRICSWAVLRDKQNNSKLWFGNTHFDHRGRTARYESGKLIQKRIAKKSGVLPVILVGDFNCLPDSDPYQAIITTSDKPLIDARLVSDSPVAGPKSTWCGFKEIAPNRIIDHIFVAGPVDVESLTVLNPKTDKDRFASDHLPVQVVVRTPNDTL